MKKINLKALTKPLILLACFAVLTILRPNSFPTVSNLSNVLWSISVYGIMTSGTIFVFLLGGIDLSIGSLCSLCSVACVMTIRQMGYTNIAVVCGVLMALLVGLLAGLFHGVIITRFKVPAFLITFASSTAYLGLSMVLTSNKILSCMEPALFVGISTHKILGFPVPVYLMLLVAVISWFILAKSILGADRLLWGTDAPFAATQDSYEHLTDYLEKGDAFTPEELEQVYYHNAKHVYFDA